MGAGLSSSGRFFRTGRDARKTDVFSEFCVSCACIDLWLKHRTLVTTWPLMCDAARPIPGVYCQRAIINQVPSNMQYNPNDPWERAAVGLLLGIIVLLLVSIVSVLF
jgi:hypothetical protein